MVEVPPEKDEGVREKDEQCEEVEGRIPAHVVLVALCRHGVAHFQKGGLEEEWAP